MNNCTILPNEIFQIHLSANALAIYSYLRRLADPETHQCWPSYANAGVAGAPARPHLPAVRAVSSNGAGRSKKGAFCGVDVTKRRKARNQGKNAGVPQVSDELFSVWSTRFR